MNTLKQMLINRALTKHTHIYPLNDSTDIKDGFTEMNGKLIFWYNAEKPDCDGKSTCVEMHPEIEKEVEKV